LKFSFVMFCFRYVYDRLNVEGTDATALLWVPRLDDSLLQSKCCHNWKGIIVNVEVGWQLVAKYGLTAGKVLLWLLRMYDSLLQKEGCQCWKNIIVAVEVRWQLVAKYGLTQLYRKALLWMLSLDNNLLQSKGCHSWKSNIIDGMTSCNSCHSSRLYDCLLWSCSCYNCKNINLAVDLRWQLFREQQLLSKGILIPWLSSSCLLLIWLDYAGRLPSGVGGFAHDGHVVSGRWTAGGLRLDDLDKLLKVSAGIFCGNISERHLDLWLFRFARGAENFKSYKFMQVLFITGSFLIFVSKTIE